MIKSLEVFNITTVAHQKYEFEGVCHIYGINSAGKTSTIYEPLDCVLHHKTFPVRRIRRGCTQSRIVIELEDDKKIERIVTKSKQITRLYIKDKQVGRDIDTIRDAVETVQNFTGFKSIKLDQAKPATSVQFIPVEAPMTEFIQGTTPEALYKMFSSLMAGDDLPNAKKNIITKTNSFGQEIKSYEKDISAKQEKLNAIAEFDLEEAEQVVRVFNHNTQTIKNLDAFIASATEHKNFMSKGLETLSLINYCLLDKRKLEDNKKKIEIIVVALSYGDLVTANKLVGEALAIRKRQARIARDILLTVTVIRLNNLYTAQEKSNVLMSRLHNIDGNKKAIQAIETQVKYARDTRESIKAQRRVLSDLAATIEQEKKKADLCPTCGKPL